MNLDSIFKKIVLGVILLTFIGCSSSSSESDEGKKHSPNYEVLADNDFSVGQKDKILNAILDWNQKTEGLAQFELKFVDRAQLKQGIDPGIIYVYHNKPDPKNNNLLGWTAWNNEGAYVQISTILGDDLAFLGVVVHELGHSLRLAHYEGPYKAIMHGGLDINHNTYQVECPDIQAFCKEWSCNIDCTPKLVSESIKEKEFCSVERTIISLSKE